jgi:hypothetical protein
VINQEPIPLDSDSVEYGVYTKLLMSAVDVDNTWIRWGDHRGKLSDLSGLSLRLGNEDEVAVRIARMYAAAIDGNDPDAALRFLSFIDEWPPSRPGPNFESGRGARAKLQLRGYFLGLRHKLLNRDSRLAARYLDNVLQKAEQEAEATSLLRLAPIVVSLPIEIPVEQRDEFGSRVLTAIHNVTHPNDARDVALLRNFALRFLARVEKPAFSFDDRQGAWQAYTRVPIKLSGGGRDLLAVFIDPRPDAIREGGPIVLLWRAGGSWAIERVSRSSNQPRKIGPDIPALGSPPAFRHYQMAFGPDAVFVSSSSGGFTMVRQNSIESFGEVHGAPSSDLWSMAWLRDRLFLAYRDALVSFDPRTKTFRLLASGTSVEPSNPIDGRGSFFIRYLFADEQNANQQNACLWMTVQDNAVGHERTGLWKFDPTANTYQKLDSGRPVPTRTDGGWLLHDLGKLTVRLVDGRTAMLTDLIGYSAVPVGILQPPAAIMVGDHIVTKSGALHTPDGKEHRLRTEGNWNLLQRVEEGFITHYDETSAILWYFTRK